MAKAGSDPRVRIVTWNINSIRARLDMLLDWVEAEEPDILCLQETKVTDQEFPEDELGDLDYDVIYLGEPSYNGVAIACRDEAEAVVRNLPGDGPDAQKRLIAATIGGLRVVNVYVPNGGSLDSPRFPEKLAWYERLHDFLARDAVAGQPRILCGDFNVCPGDLDCWDPERLAGSIFLTEPERAAWRRLGSLGLSDAFRHLHPDARQFSWWDYRDMGFEKNAGLRIDHFLVSPEVLARVERVEIHTALRAEPGASDHAPVSLWLS